MEQFFENVAVAGIPLLAVVIGLVQFVKGFGFEGKGVRALSAMIGLALGIGYQLSVAMPADFAGWFGAVVFGLGLGVVASGVYDALNKPQP